MKKIAFLLILFLILAISFTATMINIKKINQFSTKPAHSNIISNNEIASDDKIDSVITENTLDLYSTYDENDLKIDITLYKNSYITDTSYKTDIPQIKGLKNKEIENKINADIKNRIDFIINEIGQNDSVKNLRCTFDEYKYANFANVISFCEYINYSINDKDYSKKIGLNYELISGDKLEPKDLFTANTTIEDILRIAIYKGIAQYNEDEWDYDKTYGEPFFNNELGIWQQKITSYSYNEATGEVEEYEQIVDFVSRYEEHNIEKYVNKWMNSGEFFFTNSKVMFEFEPSYSYKEINDEGEKSKYEEYTGYLYFKDIPDRVVIYNKYLTEESLFEEENVGNKNILTCSEERTAPMEKETKFFSDNYFCDYTLFLNKYTYSYSNNSSEYSYSNVLIDNVNSKMQEIIDYYKRISDSDKEKAYFLFIYPFDGDGRNDLYNGKVYFTTKLIKCDIYEKNNIMDQLFNNVYRYHNIAFYGSLLYSKIGNDGEYTSFKIDLNNATLEHKYYYYDIESGELVAESLYKYLREEDINWYSLDTLNKTYNEIFARHGHDFKSKELKDYFSLFDWYTPIPGKVVSMSELTEIERQNAEMILKIINDKKS